MKRGVHMGAERRQHKRVVINEKASLHKDNDRECFLIDISPGGMKVLLENEVTTGDTISGQFKILPNCGPFYVKGVVTWIRPIKDKTENANYAIGIKFTQVNTIPF
jgi:hypothetical protein